MEPQRSTPCFPGSRTILLAGVFAVLSMGQIATAVELRQGDILVAQTNNASMIHIDPETRVHTLVAQGGLLQAPVSVTPGRRTPFTS